MGKINLNFNFLDETGNVASTITFESLEEIDEVIEKLQEARSEFEHRIEMKKQKMREKRRRRKERTSEKSNGSVEEMEKSYKSLMYSYNAMPKFYRDLFKPATDAITELVEKARKGNVK